MGYLARLFAATEEENRATILGLLPPGRGGELLDVGTSEGAFTARVRERLGAIRATGVELIAEHAHAARTRGVETVAADVEQGLPFEDGRFATVHANQVIEHLRETDRFLEEVRRVLEPGGLACISTNNLSSWHNVFSLALGWQPMPAHASGEIIVGNPLNPERGHPHADAGRVHLRLFTRRALAEVCANHGLRPIALLGAGYYPLPPALAAPAARLDPVHAAYVTGLFAAPG
jgi:SAM-dependent methyltransferase